MLATGSTPAHQIAPVTHPQPVSVVKKPTLQDVVRQAPKHTTKRKPQSSKTLMRHVVKKPQASTKRSVKAHTHTHALVKQPTAAVVAPKQSLKTINEKRLQHAQKVSQSQAISRFGSLSTTPEVAQAVTVSAPYQSPSAPITPQPAVRAPKTTADILEQALHHATSHKQAPPKKLPSLQKRLSVASVGLVSAGLIIGIMVSQNVTGLKLQMASAKAGFSAGLPHYQAPGFHVDNFHYSAGVVAIDYRSNSDDRAYTLTEKASAWDSQTLREAFVAKTTNAYQTVQTADRTVFIYGQNQATWVTGGIWYQVQSNGSLSNRQLVDLANSL